MYSLGVSLRSRPKGRLPIPMVILPFMKHGDLHAFLLMSRIGENPFVSLSYCKIPLGRAWIFRERAQISLGSVLQRGIGRWSDFDTRGSSDWDHMLKHLIPCTVRTNSYFAYNLLSLVSKLVENVAILPYGVERWNNSVISFRTCLFRHSSSSWLTLPVGWSTWAQKISYTETLQLGTACKWTTDHELREKRKTRVDERGMRNLSHNRSGEGSSRGMLALASKWQQARESLVHECTCMW